jgi:hypothetical protein
MKLHAKESTCRIGERRDRRIATMRDPAPTRWHSGHFIAVTHPYPHGIVFLESVKQIGITIDCEIGGTILAMISTGHLAAGCHIDHTHAVTDAQKRHA